jgi:hypothetical protein
MSLTDVSAQSLGLSEDSNFTMRASETLDSCFVFVQDISVFAASPDTLRGI